MKFQLYLLLASFALVANPAKSQGGEEAVIAFTGMTSTTDWVVENATIPFDYEISNFGNRFAANLGVFVCPDDALYLFQWNLMSPVNA